jgi:hypothetical protein
MDVSTRPASPAADGCVVRQTSRPSIPRTVSKIRTATANVAMPKTVALDWCSLNRFPHVKIVSGRGEGKNRFSACRVRLYRLRSWVMTQLCGPYPRPTNSAKSSAPPRTRRQSSWRRGSLPRRGGP